MATKLNLDKLDMQIIHAYKNFPAYLETFRIGVVNIDGNAERT